MKDSLENQAIQLLLLDALNNKMTWMRDGGGHSWLKTMQKFQKTIKSSLELTWSITAELEKFLILGLWVKEHTHQAARVQARTLF